MVKERLRSFNEVQDKYEERQLKITEHLREIDNDLDFFKLTSRKNVGETANILQNM